MFNQFEFFIALRYLKAKKQESFISVIGMFSLIGIAIGVAALISTMAVMEGVKNEWTDKLVGFDGDINIYSRESDRINQYQLVINKFNYNAQIKFVIPLIDKQTLVAANQKNIGVQLKGINLLDLKRKIIISDNIISGSIDNFQDNNIIIGFALAKQLGVYVSDEIKIISPQINSTLIGQIPRFKTCKVIAIFDTKSIDFDSGVIFANLGFVQNFFKMENSINNIEIYSKAPNESDIFADYISKIVGDDFQVLNWKNKNAALMGALQVEKVAMFTILTLIIIVAAFNIISSLTMLVKDKTHDIAILRTMGANKKSIIKIFFICGFSIGMIGTISGLFIGILFANNVNTIKIFLENLTGTTIFDPIVYFLNALPAKLVAQDIISVAAMSLTMSFVATIYPAFRAANLNPSSALRYS